MRLAQTKAVTLTGLTGQVVSVEAHVAAGLPAFQLVGLPDASLTESIARVRSACQNSALQLPSSRITVNLSPAGIPKHGTSFDLAIALAVLAAAEAVSRESVSAWLHIGELGLDGSLRGVRGVLPAVMTARAAGVRGVIVPLANEVEAKLVAGIEVLAASSLSEVAKHHGANVAVQHFEPEVTQVAKVSRRVGDLSEVRGQPEGVLALTLAAAGAHNLLFWGAPGCGKTMLAERLPALLPDLTLEQSIETTALHSISGLISDADPLITRPPFQAPHHSISPAAMVGGGSGQLRPGAISRSHNGVLFLDEATEFQRGILEMLRQPLESGEILLARAQLTARFPARFQLVLAANPCPCGNRNSTRHCRCSFTEISRYESRLSGPLLDRIDIRLQLRAVNPKLLAAAAIAKPEQTTADLRAKVEVARMAAIARWKSLGMVANAQVAGELLRGRFRPPKHATQALDRRLEREQISLRGYDRVLRIAWTLADLAGRDLPTADDVDTAGIFRGNYAMGKAA